MDEIWVFRCDYCGEISDCDNARIFWSHAEQLNDGSQRQTPAVYCSPYCGRTATAPSGSGRG